MRWNDLLNLMLLFSPDGGGGGDAGAGGGDAGGDAGAAGKAGDAGGGDAGGGDAGGGDQGGGDKGADSGGGDAGDGDTLLGRDAGDQGDKGGDGDAGKPEGDTGAPESYGDFTVPDGWEVDSTHLDMAKPVFKEMGLTQEQAQKVVDLQVQITESQQKQWVETRKSWSDEVRSDPDVGGDKLESNILAVRELIGRAVSKEDAADLWSYFRETGAGNYPPLFRLLTKLANATGEDSFAGPGRQGGKSEEQEFLDSMYPTMKKEASG